MTLRIFVKRVLLESSAGSPFDRMRRCEGLHERSLQQFACREHAQTQCERFAADLAPFQAAAQNPT